MSTYIKIGSDEFEPGCYVDGHWGQYGPDHLADKFDHVLDLEPDDDPRVWRQRAEAAEEAHGYKPEPICGSCGESLDYRRDRERWVHVLRFRVLDLRVEYDAGCTPVCTWPAASCWEACTEAADKIVERLNEMTPDGYVWDWVDGEFFLMPICDDDENCTDETCAHWAYA